MSRKKRTYRKHEAQPDHAYNNVYVSKMINQLMRDGKRAVAQKMVYRAFDLMKETNQDPLETFNKALRFTSPQAEVRTRRVGGASYLVPREVRAARRTTLAIRWLINAARARKGASVAAKLHDEILDAAQGKGDAVRKRAELERVAEANKAFAHFNW